MESPSHVTVHSRKYDGRIHRRWSASLTARVETLLVLDGVFEEEVRHPLLGTVLAGTMSTEYYWTDRWYSIFRFREPSGQFRNYYCNVNTPVVLENGVLSFVDLDIDLLVAPDWSYKILDEDEFLTNSELYNYPPDYRQRASEAVSELVCLIQRREFPFDA